MRLACRGQGLGWPAGLRAANPTHPTQSCPPRAQRPAGQPSLHSWACTACRPGRTLEQRRGGRSLAQPGTAQPSLPVPEQLHAAAGGPRGPAWSAASQSGNLTRFECPARKGGAGRGEKVRLSTCLALPGPLTKARLIVRTEQPWRCLAASGRPGWPGSCPHTPLPRLDSTRLFGRLLETTLSARSIDHQRPQRGVPQCLTATADGTYGLGPPRYKAKPVHGATRRARAAMGAGRAGPPVG